MYLMLQNETQFVKSISLSRSFLLKFTIVDLLSPLVGTLVVK